MPSSANIAPTSDFALDLRVSLENIGIAIAASTAITATVIIISISVKPR